VPKAEEARALRGRVGSLGPVLSCANREGALDFAHDVLSAGRNIRVLSVIDAFTREYLALKVGTGFASRLVSRGLDEIIAVRYFSQAIRCYNGPELTSRHVLAWPWSRRFSCGIFSRASRRRTRSGRLPQAAAREDSLNCYVSVVRCIPLSN
jgi:transposase InsO family protein